MIYNVGWVISPNNTYLFDFLVPSPSRFIKFVQNSYAAINGIATVISSYVTLTFQNQAGQPLSVFDTPPNANYTRCYAAVNTITIGVSYTTPEVPLDIELPGNCRIFVSSFAANPNLGANTTVQPLAIGNYNGYWRGYFDLL